MTADALTRTPGDALHGKQWTLPADSLQVYDDLADWLGSTVRRAGDDGHLRHLDRAPLLSRLPAAGRRHPAHRPRLRGLRRHDRAAPRPASRRLRLDPGARPSSGPRRDLTGRLPQGVPDRAAHAVGERSCSGRRRAHGCRARRPAPRRTPDAHHRGGQRRGRLDLPRGPAVRPRRSRERPASRCSRISWPDARSAAPAISRCFARPASALRSRTSSPPPSSRRPPATRLRRRWRGRPGPSCPG